MRSLRPFGAKEDIALSEFQVELIQLASQLNGDHVLNTYPNIGKSMTVGQANRYAEDAVARFLEAGRAALKAGANESAMVTMRPSLTSRTTGASNPYLQSSWYHLLICLQVYHHHWHRILLTLICMHMYIYITKFPYSCINRIGVLNWTYSKCTITLNWTYSKCTITPWQDMRECG